MASTPATKSQVHAYKFVLRRMESALVRKDAVMLHDPMRTHQRAVMAGAVLAMVVVLGFVIYGFFNPKGALANSGIYISRQSGSVYVKLAEPNQLIPVPNLASARLLLMTQPNGGGGGAAEVKAVDDSALALVPRGPLTGILGAPDFLPTKKEQWARPHWSLCDTLVLDDAQPNPEAAAKITTTAVIGVPEVGRKLAEDEALLVETVTKETYLIYRVSDPGKMPNNASAVRAKVDLNADGMRDALRVRANTKIRKISTGLLNAIPEVKALKSPEVTGDGDQPGTYKLGSAKVGGVVRVEGTGTERYEYFMLLKDGKQPVSEAVANLIRYTDKQGTRDWITLRPDEVGDVETKEEVNLRDYPARVPKILEPRDNRVSCLGWHAEGEKESTWVTVAGDRIALPPVKEGGQQKEQTPVKLATADSSGDGLDEVYMPPGKAAVVRSATSTKDFTTGPMFLVSDRGVRFGIPNGDVAKGLGLGDAFDPAPESIMKMLPLGPELNPENARQMFDTVPLDEQKIVRRPSLSVQPSNSSEDEDAAGEIFGG